MYLLKCLINWLNDSCQDNKLDSETQANLYYFELEVGWIMCNLAVGSEAVVNAIFFDSISANKAENVASLPVLRFFHRQICSGDPARLVHASWVIANSCDSFLVADLLVNHSEFQLILSLYNAMFLKPIRKQLIASTMWCVSNMARKQAFMFDVNLESEQLLRTMVRAAMSLDGDSDLVDDSLTALHELCLCATDSFKQLLFDKDLVGRLMDLVKSLSSLGISERFKLQMTLRVIGEMISTAGIDKSLQIFFERKGLDTFNQILKT